MTKKTISGGIKNFFRGNGVTDGGTAEYELL